ncbi:Zn-dependent exopeptidase [Artomyces pyxidatus]|uniref:Zn-dependent exopeptidase n=1 Tax=Artomyces pyxidatus TaxID=48021 RepID=A0ACB8SHH4_9AGAM|nr:Zn-dependent exopeptidase [Artomyces pyxidatus]
MTFLSALHAIFSFHTISTSVLAVLIYAAVFVSLFITDQLPPVPSPARQQGLSLDRAYKDLNFLAARPHPYNSHANDVVREYVLQRVQDIASGHEHVHIVNDTTSTAAFFYTNRAVYFEGNNIIVKVDGTDETAKGVLFSAHFDSVSTAPGATDDSMSVTALLQMLAYLAENRPRLTAVFNINNGEEDGLHGAIAFLQHPWSNLTTKFLNVEGAGSGGRPFLFRTTSLDVLRAFKSVPHPHANVLSADAWSRGIIRSDTDYSIYAAPRAGGGMDGADVAFYKGRARYHTAGDSVRGMGRDGAKRALWAVMAIARNAGQAMLNTPDNDDVVGQAEGAVYFELFGSYLITLPLRVLLAINVVLASAGPIVVIALAFFLYRQSLLTPQRWWAQAARGYGRFWLALLLSVAAQVGLVFGFLQLNPMTVHAHYLATTVSIVSLAYLTLAAPLTVAQYVRPIPAAKQKLVVLGELYFLTWVLLVGATVLVQRTGLAGTYWVGLWNAGLLLALVFAMMEGLWGKGRGGREILEDDEHRNGEGSTNVVVEAPEDGVQEEEEASETTPLINGARDRELPKDLVLDEEVQDKAFIWWIIQMILSVPVPLITLGAILLLWLGSMPQTAPDGGWVGVVYAPLSLLCLLLLLPIAPFAHKMHRSLTLLILVVFIATTAYAWLVWPFDTTEGRLKVFFRHRAELSNTTSHASASSPHLVRAITELTVVSRYAELLAKELPSTWTSPSPVISTEGQTIKGLTTYSWEVGDDWSPSVQPATSKDATWFHVNATRLDATSARFEIRGTNTRACKLYLDNRHLQWFRARTIPGGRWSGREVPDGMSIDEVALWSRDWGRAFEVEMRLDEGNDEQVRGRVACSWNSASARIPAFEETLAFLPEWAAVTKAREGLLEATSAFIL